MVSASTLTAMRGAVTNETAIKPEYKGTGMLMFGPTHKHLIFMDVALLRAGDW